MSNEQVERYLERIGDKVIEPPDAKDQRELAGWICVGCFDGVIRFPLVRHGAWRDQGVDLFREDQPVKRFHHCAGQQYKEKERAIKLGLFPTGNWHLEKIVLTEEMWAKLVASKGIEPGVPTLDPSQR